MIKRGLLAVIGFYSRAISPALPARCRFYPTCSAYAAEAIARHGAVRGSWLALRRLVKCAPWHPGGVDPVPVPREAGTRDGGHSSSTAAPFPASRAHGPSPAHRATPSAVRRANEESSVA
jgi:putative membrane protein insertion efficiency factor